MLSRVVTCVVFGAPFQWHFSVTCSGESRHCVVLYRKMSYCMYYLLYLLYERRSCIGYTSTSRRRINIYPIQHRREYSKVFDTAACNHSCSSELVKIPSLLVEKKARKVHVNQWLNHTYHYWLNFEFLCFFFMNSWRVL